MTDRADELTVLRQAYVLLALAGTLTRDAAQGKRGTSGQVFQAASDVMKGARAAIVAFDDELHRWAGAVDHDFNRVSGVVSTRTSIFASVRDEMLADAFVLHRSERDELEAEAVGSSSAWRGVRKDPSERLLAVLGAAQACLLVPANLLAEDRNFGAKEFWACLDGDGCFIDDIKETPRRMLDAKSRWKGYFAAFIDEARQLPGDAGDPRLDVAHALTFGRLYPVKLADVPRMFGVSADALKSVLGPRERGSLTIDEVQRTLGLDRVRMHDREVETMNLNGARIHIYKGTHPLLDRLPDETVVGHADYDLAPADRGQWREGGEPWSAIDRKKLCLFAASALGLPAVELGIETAVPLRAGDRVLGVRFMIEFRSVPEPG